MTASWIDNQKNLMLFAGRSHPELAEQVAKELDVHVTPQTARDFANGEIFVRFEESVRGSDAFVLQSFPAPLNQWLMEQLIMIDALKRGSAKRITAILPFYPYARQDKKHRGREPISARLVADLLKTAGADRIVTVDLHTDQIQGFFDGPVDHMHAQLQLAEYIRTNYSLENITVVSPDSGRVRVAEKWADSLDGAPLAFIHKTRDPLVPNQVKSNRVVGEVEGRTCILIDDMIDTGGTIAGAVNVLREAGAGDVVIAATHGVLSAPAAERLAACGAKEVVVTNTLPITEEKKFPQLTVLSIAPLLARTIREVFENGSVTGLFNGNACPTSYRPPGPIGPGGRRVSGTGRRRRCPDGSPALVAVLRRAPRGGAYWVVWIANHRRPIWVTMTKKTRSAPTKALSRTRRTTSGSATGKAPTTAGSA